MRAALQPTLAEQLKDMVHDLEYLCEMKRLEYAPAGEKSLHIVPVGGLVMGTFVRLENEVCNTQVCLCGAVVPPDREIGGPVAAYWACRSRDLVGQHIDRSLYVPKAL